MYYAFNENGICVASGKYAFTIPQTSVVVSDTWYEVGEIKLENGVIIPVPKADIPKEEEEVVALPPVVSETLATIAELSELIVTQQLEIETLKAK